MPLISRLQCHSDMKMFLPCLLSSYLTAAHFYFLLHFLVCLKGYSFGSFKFSQCLNRHGKGTQSQEVISFVRAGNWDTKILKWLPAKVRFCTIKETYKKANNIRAALNWVEEFPTFTTGRTKNKAAHTASSPLWTISSGFVSINKGTTHLRRILNKHLLHNPEEIQLKYHTSSSNYPILCYGMIHNDLVS